MMKPLVVVTRNQYVESIHNGLVCVTDASGRVLHQVGDIHAKIFFRSCAKPIQAIPVIKSGAAKALGFTLRDIAIACASHSGQKFHQETVQGMLKKLDLDESSLHCGIMAPYNEAENNRLISEGLSPSVFHCTCSGKHSAMLALGKFRGVDLKGYEDISNPVQQEILETIAHFSGEPAASIPTAIDGCGAPIYVLPVHAIALSYARLMQYALDKESEWHASSKAVFDAMTQHPEMVAGEGEFCTELMRGTKGKLIGKAGAEGVYCLGIRDKKLGICIKITDGHERAVYPAAMQALRELDILDDEEFSRLRHWHTPAVKNHPGMQTGEIIPVFGLKKPVAREYVLGERL
jgi:L-asparaginase II